MFVKKVIKVKAIDEDGGDIHVEIKPQGIKEDCDNPFDAAEQVFDQDDKDIILHTARKIAQKHKKEMPLTATYTLLAAFLSKKGEECMSTSIEAFKKAQNASKHKSREEVRKKLKRFHDSLTEDELAEFVKMLDEE